jgi:nitrite reductase (NADH) small subunit
MGGTTMTATPKAPSVTAAGGPSWDEEAGWVGVCPLEDVIPDTGVCAFIDGRQIAIVRVGAGERLFAVGNFDPFSRAFVISRGIVGDKDGVPKIASPIFKQSFDLATGVCLESPEVALPTYRTRVRAGQVEVQMDEEAGSGAGAPADPPADPAAAEE